MEARIQAAKKQEEARLYEVKKKEEAARVEYSKVCGSSVHA